MISRDRRWACARAAGLSVTYLAAMFLVGCDTAPDPNFEQKVQQRRAEATGGDPYDVLMQRLPRQARYLQAQPQARQAAAGQEAATFQPMYGAMLKKLDDEPGIPALAELTTMCRAAFARADAFHGDPSINVKSVTEAALALGSDLLECRDAAVAVTNGDAETAAERAHILRRFATCGLLIVGPATVSRGDEPTGLALWRKCESLLAEDGPRFKFKPTMLLGK